VRFEWDPPKAEANLRAHGVSFAEAVTVLEDDFALTREDPAAVDEPRLVKSKGCWIIEAAMHSMSSETRRFWG
jgi:uncharacterized DUF497 family protein